MFACTLKFLGGAPKKSLFDFLNNFEEDVMSVRFEK